jgi:uncharacterized membrane protein YfcA
VLLAALPLGLLVGLAVGLLGGGGSVLAVPIFVYLLDQDVGAATTASLLVVTAGALAGGLAHHRAGRVCWRHAVAFSLAAVPGIIAGTAAGDALSDGLVLSIFAVVMLGAAAATWRRASEDEPAGDGCSADVPDVCPPLRGPRDIAAGFGVGVLTGLLGVGGGFLIVPTLAIALAFTMRSAVGTSLAIITATSAIGLVTHLVAGRTLEVDVTAGMTAGAVLGAIAGAALAGRVPQRELGRGFAVLVVAVAGYLLVEATVFGGPSGAS